MLVFERKSEYCMHMCVSVCVYVSACLCLCMCVYVYLCVMSVITDSVLAAPMWRPCSLKHVHVCVCDRGEGITQWLLCNRDDNKKEQGGGGSYGRLTSVRWERWNSEETSRSDVRPPLTKESIAILCTHNLTRKCALHSPGLLGTGIFWKCALRERWFLVCLRVCEELRDIVENMEKR